MTRPATCRQRTLRTDDELLSSDDPEAFGVFYDRHVKALLGYFARRTLDPEEAADLTAETFASALVARRRFKPGQGRPRRRGCSRSPRGAWPTTSAAGWVEQRMRRSLEMERRPVERGGRRDDPACSATTPRESVLAELPPEQRGLVAAHVIDERPYGELAGELHTSEAALRQRMSRSLATLRARGSGDERLRLRAAADLVEAAERQAAARPRPPRDAPAASARVVAAALARRGAAVAGLLLLVARAARGHAAAPARGAAKVVAARSTSAASRATRSLAGGSLVDRRLRGRRACGSTRRRAGCARASRRRRRAAVVARGRRHGAVGDERPRRSARGRSELHEARRRHRPPARARAGSTATAGSIALGAGGLWLITDVSSVRVGGRTLGGLEKFDPRTGERTLVLPRRRAPRGWRCRGGRCGRARARP